MKETLSKVADYNKLEKEKAVKAGNIAFCTIFFVCAAAISVQLVMTGDLSAVAGETVTLLVGGAVYIGIMLYHGVWETGSWFKSTPVRDLLISLMCAGIFAAVLGFRYIRMGIDTVRTVRFAFMFFAGTAVIGFALLRALAYCNSKRSAKGKEK